MIKLKELLNSQGEETKFEKGMAVKDINPDCPHKNSVGVVTKVDKDDVTSAMVRAEVTVCKDDVTACAVCKVLSPLKLRTSEIGLVVGEA